MKKTLKDRAPESSTLSFTVKALPIAAILGLTIVANTSQAQTAMPTMEVIPTFDDSAFFTQSDALGISGDGSVVVGAATDAAAGRIAFSFAGGTLTNLVPLGSANPSAALGASFDGSVIAGYQFNSMGPIATYWTQATGAVAIPTGPTIYSRAEDVSGDGTRIVGTLFGDGVSPPPVGPTAPAAYDRAFVWTHATNTIVTLTGLIPGGATLGNDISNDGAIVVGRADNGTANHAFRAVVGGAISDLGTIGGAAGSSEANGVSGDGLVVVGQSVAPAATGQRAFRWSAGTAMVQLNSTDEANVTFSLANAASEDGSYVAGAARYSTTPGYRAIRWDGAGVATDLGDFTTNNDGTSFASGISADGSIVVGNASNDAGNIRGFIWRDAVQPGGTMLDHINTLTQVANNAAEQAAGALYLDKIVQFTLGQSLELPVGGADGDRSKAGIGRPYSLRIAAGAANNPDGNNTAVAGLTAAMALNDNMSFGGHLGLGKDDGDLAGFGIDGTFQTFGAYLQGGHPSTEGLNWKVAAAQTSAQVEITRSTALANTERGTGTTDMSARAASVEMGYAMRRGSALITPFMRVARSSVQRDGYSETGSVAFPVTYNDYEVNATLATLGTDVRLPVSDAGVVRLTAGVEWDLSRSTDAVTGTSAIPGMTSFAIAAPTLEHEERLFAEARYTHSLGNGRSYDLGVGLQQTAYAEKPSLTASIGYQMDF
ncbi:autotransporter domain-containing protein [Aliiroseovarius sp. S1339]|uniref:autotransporter domain-containing protein n=1 Tax=Aliiroseovarius sp. S1339 TaxID=2936990 RepID=UPI0020BE619E|nr:autotransporter domain-containing protein [Aliiroseovarius sp. S1339]MCK8462990.1 autotransporter domain-containing protein [Aliiroseovarius sp. S1339]